MANSKKITASTLTPDGEGRNDDARILRSFYIVFGRFSNMRKSAAY